MSDVEPDARTDVERNADVQNAYRHANEGVVELSETFGLGGAGQDRMRVFCECGAPGCSEAIELDRSEYEQVRGDGRHFVLVPGHETEAVERVVARTDRYVIAENNGRAAAIAREQDPRRPA